MKSYIVITISMLVCLIIFFGLGGCSISKDNAKVDEIANDELAPVSSIILSEEEARKLNEELPIHLYFANEEQTKLIKEIRYIPVSEAKKSVSNLASYIVKELVKGPSNTRLMKATIPKGTQLRAPVRIKERVAILDMTKEFVENHPGGKKLEELTIYSITNSLTELKEIEKVRFLINGKAQKEYKGSFKFDAEFPRNEVLIDKKLSQSSIQEVSQAKQTGQSKDKQEKAEILE